MSEFDLVVRGATVVDGTGAPAREADVGIRGSVITAVGDCGSGGATEELDGCPFGPVPAGRPRGC